MLRLNFYRSDGRQVKLFLFSTLLDKSPLTSIYFATFEKKREVRSPLPTQSKFLVFGKYRYIYIYRSNLCRSVWENYTTCRDDRPLIRKEIKWSME